MTDRVVKVVLRGQIDDFVGKMRASSSAAKSTADAITGADKEARKFREGLTAVGTSATRMGLVASAGIGLIVKAAMDWESAWAGVTKTVDGTTSEMAALESGLRDLATTLPATHQEIAAVAEAAGQLGVAREDILSFTKTMVDLGETTNLTADEAATSIAQFMNVMQTAPDEVDNLGAALVALGNDGASTERDIIQMAQNIAGAGAIVGASEADILALANGLASVGIEAEAGGSAVSKILIDMSKSVSTNSKSLEAWAATAGMTTAEFAESFGNDPIKAFDAFTQGLGEINSEGGDVFSLLSSLGQSDIRVTRALLGMANSGDLLSKSLATGSTEWERNTALTDEAAKRYDTTAAKAKVAWNGIKDSAIDAGNAILPMVAEIAEGISALTGAFSDLPGPVKSGVGIFATFGAAALLTVGGIAKLVSTVSGARVALDQLGDTAPRTAGAIGKLGRAAGIAGVALAGMRVAGELIDTDSTASVSKYTKAILDLGSGTKSLDGILSDTKGVSARIAGLSDLSATIKKADPGALNEKFGSLFGVIKLNPYKDAMDDVQAYDQALAGLVAQGALEEAALGHREFAAAAKEAGKDVDDIGALLPGYFDALTDVDNGQKIATDSASTLGAATTELTAAQKEAQDAARGQAESIVSIADAAAGAEGDLDSFQAKLIEQARALRDLRINAEEAGRKGLDEGLIGSLREAGPEGAALLAELADATDAEINQTNDAFRRGQVQVGKYSDELGGIPKNVSTKVSANTVDALNKLHGVTQYLDGMNGRVVRVHVEGTQGGILKATGGAIGLGFAAGGPIVGPGTGTSDSIPAIGPGGAKYRLSNGEHVLTTADVNALGGQAGVYAMRAALHSQKAAMKTRFADGGGVATHNFDVVARVPGDLIDYDRLALAIARRQPAQPWNRQPSDQRLSQMGA